MQQIEWRAHKKSACNGLHGDCALKKKKFGDRKLKTDRVFPVWFMERLVQFLFG
jgi:hypothetical protein